MINNISFNVSLFAQVTPAPKPSEAKIFTALDKYPELKQWVDMQSKSGKSAEEMKTEFELLRKFCVKYPPTGKRTEYDIEIPVFDNILLPTKEKIRIEHRKQNPDIPQSPERYIIYKSVPVARDKKINGKTVTEIRYVLISTVTYEFYPDKAGSLDINNCRISKMYVEELYKKDSSGRYARNLKTGLYIHEKDPATNLPSISEPKIKIIDIKGGKPNFVNAESEEEQNIENAYPETPNEPEEAKAAKRQKKARARAAVKKTKEQIDRENVMRNDPMVKYRGLPMRSSMVPRMKKLEKKVSSMGHILEYCSSTGGRHISWQHPAGYAIDTDIYTAVTKPNGKKRRQYITKSKSITFEKEMDKVNKQGQLGLLVYNEYIHDSKYKTGDHFHIARVNFAALSRDLQLALDEETGSKDVLSAREKAREIVYNALILNGYNPTETNPETIEQMTLEALKTLHKK